MVFRSVHIQIHGAYEYVTSLDKRDLANLVNEFEIEEPGWQAFPCGSGGKESFCNAGDLGSILGLERSPGEGKGYSH